MQSLYNEEQRKKLQNTTTVSRAVASVSAPRSRGRLEAFQRLASVSPRKNFQTPRSRLGLQRIGLGSQGLGNNF